MADFKDASLWIKLAFLLNMIGYVCDLFGFAIGYYGDRNAEILQVISFLTWLTATVLILVYVFLDECSGNKIVLICFIIFAFIAGKSELDFEIQYFHVWISDFVFV